MTSPPPPNLLLDPIAELTEALRTNTFGISSSSIIIERCFPITPEDRADVRGESVASGRPSARAVARARIGLVRPGPGEVGGDDGEDTGGVDTGDGGGVGGGRGGGGVGVGGSVGGSVEVVLDRRGYTLEEATSPDGSSTHPVSTTYESLEALLIAISPGYVQAMGLEIGKRFEGYAGRDQVLGEEGGMNEALQGFHGDEKR